MKKRLHNRIGSHLVSIPVLCFSFLLLANCKHEPRNLVATSQDDTETSSRVFIPEQDVTRIHLPSQESLFVFEGDDVRVEMADAENIDSVVSPREVAPPKRSEGQTEPYHEIDRVDPSSGSSVNVLQQRSKAPDWNDPSIIAQFFATLVAALIAIGLWLFEGRRIRQQRAEDLNAQGKRSMQLLKFELRSFSRGLSKLEVFLSELSINADLEREVDDKRLSQLLDKARLDRLLEYWLDGNRLRTRLDPAFVSGAIIQQVEDLVSLEEELETSVVALFDKAEAGEDLKESSRELEERVQALADDLKKVIARVV